MVSTRPYSYRELEQNTDHVRNIPENGQGYTSEAAEVPSRLLASSQSELAESLADAIAERAGIRQLNIFDYDEDSPEKITNRLMNSVGESEANTPLDSGIYSSANDLHARPPRQANALDAQSFRSVDTLAPPPTSPADNKKLTTKYLIRVTGWIYATLIVTLGFMIYIGSPAVEPRIALVFSITLYCIGLMYHIYLFIDISRYKRAALENQKKTEDYITNREGDFAMSSIGDRIPGVRASGHSPVLTPLKHDYCFNQGRHSGSFFLKLGAAGFALGHLVHSMLLLAVQISQLTDDDVDNEHCVSILNIVADLLSPIYNIVQLYFIFKYSNVIILKAQGLAHLGLIHVICSSLCFWLSAIVREILLALTLYANKKYGSKDPNDTHVDKDINARFIDISGLQNKQCYGSSALNSIESDFSPYLYPFNVEFNILVVAIYYIIWSNIGHCVNEDSTADSAEFNSTQDVAANTLCKIPTPNEDNDFASNIVIRADCHASSRGLFLGLLFMVFVMGNLIIGYVFSSFSSNRNFLRIGYLLNDCTMLTMHVVLLFAAVLAFNQIRKLDINEHPISLLDDVLLFICLPAFFMEIILTLVATIVILNPVKIAAYIAMALQVLVQTPLIMDGLRRCSNDKNLRRQKPGRDVLMFLIIANVGTWLFYTFSYKSPDSLDERYEFYGKVVWSITGHLTLPLIMFYRFHSSVCFADIWNSAYKPGSEH